MEEKGFFLDSHLCKAFRLPFRIMLRTCLPRGSHRYKGPTWTVRGHSIISIHFNNSWDANCAVVDIYVFEAIMNERPPIMFRCTKIEGLKESLISPAAVVAAHDSRSSQFAGS